MTTFVAIYRGESIGSAKIIAVSIDPTVISLVTSMMLSGPPEPDDEEPDPALRTLTRARRQALRYLCEEAS
jgi:hypothetical protein